MSVSHNAARVSCHEILWNWNLMKNALCEIKAFYSK